MLLDSSMNLTTYSLHGRSRLRRTGPLESATGRGAAGVAASLAIAGITFGTGIGLIIGLGESRAGRSSAGDRPGPAAGPSSRAARGARGTGGAPSRHRHLHRGDHAHGVPRRVAVRADCLRKRVALDLCRLGRPGRHADGPGGRRRSELVAPSPSGPVDRRLVASVGGPARVRGVALRGLRLRRVLQRRKRGGLGGRRRAAPLRGAQRGALRVE